MTNDAPPKPEPPSQGWLLTFADLVSLLITFFVLLYSMKQVDQSQWDTLRGALTGVFAEQEAVVIVRPDQFQTAESLPNLPADSLPYLEGVLRSEFMENPTLKNMQLAYDENFGTLKLTFAGQDIFMPNATKLQREGRLAIMKLADKLRHLDNRIQVIGHAAPQPLPGHNDKTPWLEAMERATQVTALFHERGLSPRIPAVSFGASHFDELSTLLPPEERLQRARRVEILIFDDRGDI